MRRRAVWKHRLLVWVPLLLAVLCAVSTWTVIPLRDEALGYGILVLGLALVVLSVWENL